MLWKTNVGKTTLYAIEDGHAMRDPHFFIDSTPEDWVGYEEHRNDDGSIATAFGCFLVDDGNRMIMIDTGFGLNAPEGMPGVAGRMPAGLETLGIDPADITDIVHTHLHPDHILGDITPDESMFFPNATVSAYHAEVAFWASRVNERSEGIMRVVDAIDSAGVLRRVTDGSDVLPGIEMVETFGHTPGHTSVLVSSGDDAVMIAGDVAHSPVQTVYPHWNTDFDIDKPQAAATRRQFFENLADSGTPMAAGHFYRPGFGRIVSREDVMLFEAIPVDVID